MQGSPPVSPLHLDGHGGVPGPEQPAARWFRLWSLLRAMRTEALVAVLTAGSTAAAFLLQIAIFHAAGTGAGTDAYFASAGIVQVVLAVSIAVVSGAVTPLLARLGRQERDDVTALLLLIIFALAVPFVAIAWTTAAEWVPMLFSGFRGEAVMLAVHLAQLAVLATPFAMASGILAAYNYAGRRFLENEAITFVLSVILAISVFLVVGPYGIIAAGWLVFARFVVQTLLQARRLRPRRLRTGLPFVRKIAALAGMLIMANLVLKIDPLVDRVILSSAPTGTLSIFAFAQAVYAAAAGVIGQALGSTAVPALALRYVEGDVAGFVGIFRRNLIVIAVVAIAAVVGAVLVVPALAALLTGNRIGSTPAELCWLLIPLAGMPVFAALGALLANAFYVMEDTRTPTLIMIVDVLVFISLKSTVFHALGLFAYCMLISLYWCANAVLMLVFVRRKIMRTALQPAVDPSEAASLAGLAGTKGKR